ncbi:general substrate transporter [Annulohypoxylon nitens]|nr:general substrate transporter [Annulohypoxylon nitens]
MSPPRASELSGSALQYREEIAGTASGFRALAKTSRTLAVTCFACIGGLLYGYNQGVFSGILTMSSFGHHMGDYVSNSTKKGWLTAILELGAWLGTLYSSLLAESLSRKYTIVASAGIFIVGVIVQTWAVQAGPRAILAGRFVTGMGVGSLSMVVPIYVAECAPPESRGLLIGVQQFAIEFGVMISFWIDYGTHFIVGEGETQSDAAWLIPLTLQLAPALVLLVGMLFMPFSPRWLVHHGREDEARKVLAGLRATNLDSQSVELEFLEIKSQSLFEKRTTEVNFPHLAKPTWVNSIKLQFVAIGSLFKTRAMLKRVMVACMTMFFSQWTGINAILYYAPNIFDALGMSSNSTSLLATGVVGVVMLLATIPTLIWVDRFGRKPILIIGALGMAFCHFAIAIIFAKNENQWERQQGSAWACIVLVWIYVAFFGWSWGPCEWILVAEVWPLSARPYGTAIATSANWMNNFIVGQVTPDMIANIRYGTFIVFGIMIALGAAFIWFLTPETSRLTLEEMDIVFGSPGTAQGDNKRMETISREIGLEAFLISIGRRASTTDAQKPSVSQIEQRDSNMEA